MTDKDDALTYDDLVDTIKEIYKGMTIIGGGGNGVIFYGGSVKADTLTDIRRVAL